MTPQIYAAGDGEFTGALLALVGLLVGTVINAITSHCSAKRQEGAHFRQLAVTAGLENWRHQNTLKIEAYKQDGGKTVMPAPDWYVLHMIKLMEIAANRKLSAEDAAKLIISNYQEMQTRTQ